MAWIVVVAEEAGGVVFCQERTNRIHQMDHFWDGREKRVKDNPKIGNLDFWRHRDTLNWDGAVCIRNRFGGRLEPGFKHV